MRRRTVILAAAAASFSGYWLIGPKLHDRANIAVDADAGHTTLTIPFRSDPDRGVGDSRVEGDAVFESNRSVIAPVGPREDSATAPNVRVWPVEPGAMASIVLNEFVLLPESDALSITSLKCSTTDCELRYLSTKLIPAIIRPGSAFYDTFANPPYNAHFGIEGRRSEGANEITVRLNSSPPSPSTADERDDQLRQEAAMIRSFAKNALPSDSHTAPPVAFGKFDGADQVVENVCSYDCPRDTRRMIYLRFPAGQGLTCEQFNGTEERMTTLGRSGGFEERTFCVPKLLAESQD